MDEKYSHFKWDDWQKEVIDTEGDLVIRAGRQTGKSTVVAYKVAQFASNNPNTTTLVIAAAQRQSSELFEKVRGEIEGLIDQGAIKVDERPTLTKIKLNNGSRIIVVPSGRTGWSIRCYTVDLLVADEAAFIPDAVWVAVRPMLSVAKTQRGFGWQLLLSTPLGKRGYFYQCFKDPDFQKFHIPATKCKRHSKEFLDKEKTRMTKNQFAQEYMAEFLDDYAQFFPTKLIESCITCGLRLWNIKKDYSPKKRYYMGVDIARFGSSDNAYVIGEAWEENLNVIWNLSTKKKETTKTAGRIQALDEEWDFRKIYIDDAGVGGGVYDMLTERESPIRRKVVGINNAKRSIDKEGRTGTTRKEDIYAHALMLMERGKIRLKGSPSLVHSLESITYEYTREGRLRISGRFDHLAEAFVRACWGMKDKGLKCFIA